MPKNLDKRTRVENNRAVESIESVLKVLINKKDLPQRVQKSYNSLISST